MKKKNQSSSRPKTKNFHFHLNLIVLFAVLSFSLTTPLAKPFTSTKPEVKAVFVSAPIIPTSNNLAAPSFTAISVFAIDPISGLVLFAKNPNQRLKPASLTKIMTSLVALDYYQPDSTLTVNNGAKSLGNTAKLVAGDQMIEADMLYALLVPSGNDAAVTLAENYPGGYQAFIDAMNTKAQSLGLQNTHFSNVSGVEGPNHYSSAYDMAMMAKAGLQRNEFLNIVSTSKVTLKSLKGYLYPLETTNKLLGKNGVLGVKTGWTPEAGECLVSYSIRDNHPVITAVMGSADRFGETQKLLDWIYQNYSW